MLAIYDPLSTIAIHTDGSLEIDKNISAVINKLMLSPLQMRYQYEWVEQVYI